MITRIFNLLVIILIMCVKTYAQDENCEITLTRATEEFQNGHFYLIPAILDPCLNNFTQEQQQRANILLAQTYLLLDDPIGASQSYLRILRANPEFVADENLHPSDFVYLSKKFTTAPVFAWFAKGGANVMPVRVIHDLDVFDDTSKETYSLKFGYHASVGTDFYVKENYNVRLEVNYTFSSYQHTTTNFFQDDSKEFIEKQSWISLPVSVGYSYNKYRIKPYGYLGFSAGWLLRDVANTTIQKVRTSEDERDDQESPEWDFLYKRNRLNYSFLGGVGLKTKFRLNYFFIDFRYAMGLTNIVNGKNLYVNNDAEATSEEFTGSNMSSISYAHVDDYFKVDNLAFSIGYIRPVYKPREIRKSGRKFFGFMHKK